MEEKNLTLLTHRVKALFLARIYPDSLRHPPSLAGSSCDATNLLDSSLSMRLVLCRTHGRQQLHYVSAQRSGKKPLCSRIVIDILTFVTSFHSS